MNDAERVAFKYGRPITTDDVVYADHATHLVQLTPAAYWRFIAAVQVESDERGAVLVRVCDLPPVTDEEVAAFERAIDAHMSRVKEGDGP
jgi:hypothetical protein